MLKCFGFNSRSNKIAADYKREECDTHYCTMLEAQQRAAVAERLARDLERELKETSDKLQARDRELRDYYEGEISRLTGELEAKVNQSELVLDILADKVMAMQCELNNERILRLNAQTEMVAAQQRAAERFAEDLGRLTAELETRIDQSEQVLSRLLKDVADKVVARQYKLVEKHDRAYNVMLEAQQRAAKAEMFAKGLERLIADFGTRVDQSEQVLSRLVNDVAEKVVERQCKLIEERVKHARAYTGMLEAQQRAAAAERSAGELERELKTTLDDLRQNRVEHGRLIISQEVHKKATERLLAEKDRRILDIISEKNKQIEDVVLKSDLNAQENAKIACKVVGTVLRRAGVECIFSCGEMTDPVLMSCTHVFNRDAVDQWFIGLQEPCPLCREFSTEFSLKGI